MKIKIIDLLNMISKGEEVPKKIKVHDTEYYKCILKTGIDYKIYSDDFYYLSNDICKAGFSLNDEVEIIEEEKKIPERLDYCDENTFMFKCKENSYLTREEMRLLDSNFKELGNKINSVIDYLKSKGE